jgi:hypothetical protein
MINHRTQSIWNVGLFVCVPMGIYCMFALLAILNRIDTSCLDVLGECRQHTLIGLDEFSLSPISRPLSDMLTF